MRFRFWSSSELQILKFRIVHKELFITFTNMNSNSACSSFRRRWTPVSCWRAACKHESYIVQRYTNLAWNQTFQTCKFGYQSLWPTLACRAHFFFFALQVPNDFKLCKIIIGTMLAKLKIAFNSNLSNSEETSSEREFLRALKPSRTVRDAFKASICFPGARSF